MQFVLQICIVCMTYDKSVENGGYKLLLHQSKRGKINEILREKKQIIVTKGNRFVVALQCGFSNYRL